MRPPWKRQYWWVLLVLGALLVVVGTLSQRDLLTYGGPFSLGMLCLLAGIGGGLQHFRGRRG